jgi:hypothetical protein
MMMRARRVFGIAMALAMTSGIAVAGDPSGSPGSSGTAGTPTPNPSKEVPTTQVVTPAVPDPVPVADPAMKDAKLEEIRTRARGMQPSKRESVEKQLVTSSQRVDNEAARLGEIPVQDRLAAEFGMEPGTLAAQRQHFGMGWGELMIAHTLVANSEGELTIEQIDALRKEGLGWGELAHGLGLNTSGFVTAVKNEVSVARGFTKPDGKAPVVASATKSTTKASAKGKSNAGTASPAAPSGVTPPSTK